MSVVTTDVRAVAADPAGLGRLSLVELRRYAARAGVRWLIVGMLAVVVLTAFGAWRASRPPSEEQLAAAQQQVAMAQADWEANGEQRVAECREQEAQAQQTDPNVHFGCDQMAPHLEAYLPYQATFADSAQGWLSQVATFVLLLSLIVGATFVAAEFSTGAITTWLTFEPRRPRVFASKVAVVTVATGLAALVVAVLSVGACWLATAINHAPGPWTAQLFVDLGNSAGRIAAAAAAAALLGATLGFLLRHTAAVIAVVIGWIVAIDGLLVQGLLRAPRWAVTLNLQAWLNGGFQQTVGSTSCTTTSDGVTTCNGVQLVITMTQAGLTLLALVAVVTALALLVFRRRDVA